MQDAPENPRIPRFFVHCAPKNAVIPRIFVHNASITAIISRNFVHSASKNAVFLMHLEMLQIPGLLCTLHTKKCCNS